MVTTPSRGHDRHSSTSYALFKPVRIDRVPLRMPHTALPPATSAPPPAVAVEVSCPTMLLSSFDTSSGRIWFSESTSAPRHAEAPGANLPSTISSNKSSGNRAKKK